MKVCIVGHFINNMDEGVRNVGKSMAKELENRGIELRKIDISSFSQWKEINEFHPDIIHFILSPTLSGLIVAKSLSILHFKAKTVISAVHPAIPNWKLLKVFTPDLVLIQSEESERTFESTGFQTEFLPNGVDTGKFKPVDLKAKRELRAKYGIPQDKFVILHLASFKKERNLEVLKRIQKQEGNQVIVIGRENEDMDQQIVNELQEAGCTVWIKHFSNIEEIYNLSDCYVFPTVDKKACIEMPLSVLEAMACNLPIVSTKFGALPRIFGEGEGFVFVERDEDFFKGIENLKNGDKKVKTREMVLPYSWETVAQRLGGIYNELFYSS